MARPRIGPPRPTTTTCIPASPSPTASAGSLILMKDNHACGTPEARWGSALSFSATQATTLPSSSLRTELTLIQNFSPSKRCIPFQYLNADRQPSFCSGQSRELSQSLQLRPRGHRAVLLHHRAHLQILLQNLIHILHGRPAALRNPLPPLPVNNIVVLPLLIRHRIDDSLDLLQLPLIHLRVFRQILQRPHLRQHVHKLLQRPHLANLFQLVAKIFQRESFFAQLPLEVRSCLPVNRLLRPLDERHDVAHPEHARNNPLWIKSL